MKIEIEKASTIIVARDESRAVRPLGIRVNWNMRAETVDGRQFAPRPDPLTLAAVDTDWGEQDSLANIPRARQPAWLRAIAPVAAHDEGDE